MAFRDKERFISNREKRKPLKVRSIGILLHHDFVIVLIFKVENLQLIHVPLLKWIIRCGNGKYQNKKAFMENRWTTLLLA